MMRLLYRNLPDRQGDYHAAAPFLLPGTKTLLHTHDFEEVFLVRGGRAKHRINGREKPLLRGDLIWIRAEDLHGFEVDSSGEFQMVNIAFCPRFLKHWRRLVVQEPSQHRGSKPAAKSVRLGERSCVEMLAEMMGLVGSRPSGNLRLIAFLARLEEIFSTATERARCPDWLDAVYRAMHLPENVARPMAWWHRQAGCSKEHFARLCRKHYHATPTELINLARIEWVMNRLRSDSEKVSALALDAGFNHLGHFHDLFRRVTGTTPAVWRRRQLSPIIPLQKIVH